MPPVIIVGVAVALGALAAAATWLGLRPASSVQVGQQRIPLDVLKAVIAVRAHNANASDLRNAAAKAEQCGHASLAAALRDEAAVLGAAEEFAEAEGVSVDAEPLYASPVREVSDDKWTAYVKRSRTARPSAVSGDNRMGCYAMTARELADAGWMLDAHKGEYNGRLCWLGTWAPERNEMAFLRSPSEQYDALAALSRIHAQVIERKHDDLIGREIEGKPASLSGLMGVCRRSGLGGLPGWAASAEQRKKFPETTAQYARLNGIF
jgi:hypothetical protein